MLFDLNCSKKSFGVSPFSEKQVTSTAALWDIASTEEKIETITEVINKFAEAGIIIHKEPAFYVREIELARIDNPENYTKPIGEVFRAIAVMYRDFDNGEGPDTLIRQVLGEEEYELYLRNDESKVLEEIYKEWKESRKGSE